MSDSADLVRSAIVAALEEARGSLRALDLKGSVSKLLGVDPASVGVTLRRMVEDGALVQEVQRGPYRLPNPDERTSPDGPHPVAAGSRSGVGALRVIQGGTQPGPGEYVYPFLEGGPSAGFPARALEAAELYVIAPREVVAGWTGGRVPSSREAYWTKIRGTSMEPWLPDGAPIFVAVCDRVLDGGRYVVYLDDDDAEVVKRIERLGGGVLRMVSDNPAHLTRVLRHVEDDLYEDRENDLRLRLRVRGVVLYPPDTPHAILKLIKGSPM